MCGNDLPFIPERAEHSFEFMLESFHKDCLKIEHKVSKTQPSTARNASTLYLRHSVV
jgi:hypothetical protein